MSRLKYSFLESSKKNPKSLHPYKLSRKEKQEQEEQLRLYNQAKEISDQFEETLYREKVPEPLTFTYFDPDEEDSKEDEQNIQDVVSDDGEIENFQDDEENDGDSGSVNSDLLTWPDEFDSFIYRFQNDFHITGCILNKPRRKIYSAIRKSDELSVVIIISNNIDRKYQMGPWPREIQIMRHLRGHSNIVELLGWCPISDEYYAMLLPYYPNSNLISSLTGNLSAIALFLRQVLEAVQYMHDQGVCHRDLSQYNILWDPVDEVAHIIDFNLSCFIRPHGFYRYVGCDKWDAPEKVEVWSELDRLRAIEKLAELKPNDRANYLHQNVKDRQERQYMARLAQMDTYHRQLHYQRYKPQPYTEKSDLYSIGVLFYMLIKNKLTAPEPGRLRKYCRDIRKNRLYKKYIELDLLLKLLDHNPQRRYSAQEALNHPFFAIYKEVDETYQEMREYLLKLMNLDIANDEDEDEEEDEDKKKPKKKEKPQSEEKEEDDDASQSDLSDINDSYFWAPDVSLGHKDSISDGKRRKRVEEKEEEEQEEDEDEEDPFADLSDEKVEDPSEAFKASQAFLFSVFNSSLPSAPSSSTIFPSVPLSSSATVELVEEELVIDKEPLEAPLRKGAEDEFTTGTHLEEPQSSQPATIEEQPQVKSADGPQPLGKNGQGQTGALFQEMNASCSDTMALNSSVASEENQSG